jgi:acyl-CoA synthetase (AMP-forming)/AMP-acid ligase II
VLSWVHVLEWRAAVTPDAVALTDDRGGELTYAALAAAMDREAAGYAAAGVRPGDVVPVIARNQVGWVTAMFGLVRAGALPAAVNWRLAAPEVTALLELMRPSAVVSDADCAGLAKQALAGLVGAEPALLGLGEPAAPGEPTGSAGRGELAAGYNPVLEVPARPVDRLRGPEPLVLLHTSGTTGRPKLVPLTHQMLVAADVFMKLEVPEATVGTWATCCSPGAICTCSAGSSRPASSTSSPPGGSS